MGPGDAAMEGIKESLGAFREAMGQVWDAVTPKFEHGATEIAAALLSGNDRGFVMYPRTENAVEQNHNQNADHGLHGKEVQQQEHQQEMGGREM
jgi:hypothetical protein